MYVIFDTETNGIGSFRPPTHRIMQLSWVVVEAYKDDVEKNYFISNSAQSVRKDLPHNITVDFVRKNGVPFATAFREFVTDVAKVKCVIAHNSEYDIGILRNEANLHNVEPADANVLSQCEIICTMLNNGIRQFFRRKTGKTTFPKLGDLFHCLCGEQPDISRQHDSRYDCYLLKKIVQFAINTKLIQLPSQEPRSAERNTTAKSSTLTTEVLTTDMSNFRKFINKKAVINAFCSQTAIKNWRTQHHCSDEPTELNYSELVDILECDVETGFYINNEDDICNIYDDAHRDYFYTEGEYYDATDDFHVVREQKQFRSVTWKFFKGKKLNIPTAEEKWLCLGAKVENIDEVWEQFISHAKDDKFTWVLYAFTTDQISGGHSIEFVMKLTAFQDQRVLIKSELSQVLPCGSKTYNDDFDLFNGTWHRNVMTEYPTSKVNGTVDNLLDFVYEMMHKK